MSFFTIVPSILLRGIDPLEIIEKYNSGFFIPLSLKKIESEKVSTKVAPIIFAPISNSVDDAYFTFKDRNGHTQVIVFANQQEYKAYCEGKEIKRKCHFCGREFTHEPERIPISMEERYFPSSDSPDRIKCNVVWGIYAFCHPLHCFSYIRQHLDLPYRFRDVMMQDTDIMYKNLCKQRFPDLKLRVVPLELWSEFGGSLDRDSFLNEDYTYNKISNFVIIPAKVSYERKPI